MNAVLVTMTLWHLMLRRGKSVRGLARHCILNQTAAAADSYSRRQETTARRAHLFAYARGSRSTQGGSPEGVLCCIGEGGFGGRYGAYPMILTWLVLYFIGLFKVCYKHLGSYSQMPEDAHLQLKICQSKLTAQKGRGSLRFCPSPGNIYFRSLRQKALAVGDFVLTGTHRRFLWVSNLLSSIYPKTNSNSVFCKKLCNSSGPIEDLRFTS